MAILSDKELDRLEKKHPARAALLRAVKAAGSQQKLGKALGITHQAISLWPRCPEVWLEKVERATGVPRHKLRPDLFKVEGRHQQA